MNYWDIIVSSYEGAAKGLWNYIINPIKDDGIPNFFYFLILISIGIWVLEIVIPWRKKQAIFRRDFWLDS
ncbi:sterol desaturase, partial [Crocinitomicaceae bacterium]|nr:sterol desaturase [Crocinitomicaceae bacterium]